MKQINQNSPWWKRFPWWAVAVLAIAIPGTWYTFIYEWGDITTAKVMQVFMICVDISAILLAILEYKRMNR